MFPKMKVVIEHNYEGYYAYCPDLPGCQSQGDTFEEALGNAREAAKLYLEALDEGEGLACLTRLGGSRRP